MLLSVSSKTGLALLLSCDPGSFPAQGYSENVRGFFCGNVIIFPEFYCLFPVSREGALLQEKILAGFSKKKTDIENVPEPSISGSCLSVHRRLLSGEGTGSRKNPFHLMPFVAGRNTSPERETVLPD